MLRRELSALSIRSAEITLDRYEPASRHAIQATIHGPVVLTWTESLSPTPLALSSESSTMSGNGDDPERASSSATDSLESL